MFKLRAKTVLGLILIHATSLNAATYTWTGTAGDSLWGSAGNWGGVAPTSADTANIENTTSNRTIYYDSTAATTFSTLNLTQTTAGISNILQITKGGTVTSTNNISMGNGSTSTAVAEIFIDSSKNLSSGAGSNTALSMGASGTGTLTLNTGGVLAMRGYYNDGTFYNPSVTGNVTVSGGSIISDTKVGSTSVTSANVITTYISGAFSMSSGSVSVSSQASGTYITGNRFRVGGDFSMTGGSITLGSSTSALQLDGANVTISGGSITNNTGYIMLSRNIGGSGDQTFSSSVYIYDAIFRGYQNCTKTISAEFSSDPDNIDMFGKIEIAQSTSGYSTTLKLDSTIIANSLNSTYGASGTTVGYAIDLNGQVLELANASGVDQSWTPTNSGSNTANWYITNTNPTNTNGATGTTNGVFQAASLNFSSSNTQVHVGYSAGSTASTLGTASNGPLVFRITGDGANNLGSSGSFNPNARFWYVGSAATLTAGRAIGKLEVGGDGSTPTLTLVTSNLTVQGDVKVDQGAKLDLNGLQLHLTNNANLTGSGIYESNLFGASIIFNTDATGGLSPGGQISTDDSGRNDISQLMINNATNGTTGNISLVQLADSSNSYFDISGINGGEYDSVDVAGASVIYAGTLNLNFMGGYTPIVGDSFILVMGATGSGNFTSILSNLNGYTFSFDSSSGFLTVEAIPEPSTFSLIIGALVLLGCLHFSKIQKRKAA